MVVMAVMAQVILNEATTIEKGTKRKVAPRTRVQPDISTEG
jgi:hypothetical protein